MALFGGIALTAGHAQASLIGDTVTTQYLFPNTSSVWGATETTTVASGGTTVPTDYDWVQATYGANQITLQDINNCVPGCAHSSGDWNGAPITFNGVELTDVSHPFTSVSVDDPTGPNAFTPGSYSVSLVDGSIFVDLTGRVIDLSQQLVLDVTTGANVSAVPLPGALPMFGAALLALTGLASKRRFLKA